MPRPKKLPPIHPGEILGEDFMKPLGLSMNRLALDMRVPAITRISEIVHERRGITSDTALRLGRYFNTSARFWMNAQSSYDLEVAQDELQRVIVISKIRPHIETLIEADWPIPEYTDVERMLREYDDFSIALWSGRCPAYAYMAYLRHHGFPSPFLDWSRSPYIAAFFAFSKAEGESNGRVAIYGLSERAIKAYGNKFPVVYRYGPYVRTHRRHSLQQSEYTLCLSFDDEWRFERYDTVFEIGHRQQGICRKFTIPASERKKVLRLLDEFNVNAFSLFGSEESLMGTLAVREFFLGDEWPAKD